MERSILQKRPWFKRIPSLAEPMSSANFQAVDGQNKLVYTQQRMLDEYYPTSHDIYNHLLYPDIPHELDEEVESIDPETGARTSVLKQITYTEKLPRTAFSFQQYIETKRTDHLTGNDAVFNRNWVGQDKTKDENYQMLIDGWEQCDMEDALYEAVHQANIVADAAMVFYFYEDMGEKKFGWNVYSYFKGDRIYAHTDPHTDAVILFARQFTDNFGYHFVEVWDDNDYYLFGAPDSPSKAKLTSAGRQAISAARKHEFKGGYTLDGYLLLEQKSHGFPFCPVNYKRNEDGPVWVFSQESITAYEEDFNGLRHNNKAYGEPILVSKGDDVEGIPELDGTVKNISAGKDDDVNYLQAQSAADSYMTALDKLEDMIYLQSFIVKTPELKSGDLPAAALKIIYSPAVEKAMHEVKDWQRFVNRAFAIFRYGWGIIMGKTIDFSSSNLPIKVFLVPFVHQSDSAMVADIVSAVNAKVLSRHTGAERLSDYLAEENEWERITAESKEEQQADLLYEESVAMASAKASQATKTITEG